MWLKAGNQEVFNKSSEVVLEKKIINNSSVMKALLKEVKKISKGSFPSLILGEAGSGRKMIGDQIFFNSISNCQNISLFNCSGMNSELIDNHLFLSKEDQKGLLHRLEDSTLIIENIEDISLDVQSKLVRFFQNKEILTSTGAYRFRLITIASESLYNKIEKGLFREDLFRYLSRKMLIVPSLSQREEDVSDMVKFFLDEYKFTGVLTQDALDKIKNHSWKGNVRELKNFCFQLATFHQGQVLDASKLPITSQQELELALFIKYNPKIKLEDLINYYIAQSLKHFKSKKKSAESLGISVKTIYNKLGDGVIKSS